MSEQPQAMSHERWPLLGDVNVIEMLSYLGTSELSEKHVTDEIEWVITGVWDNTFNGVVRAQLSEAHADQVAAAAEKCGSAATDSSRYSVWIHPVNCLML